MCCYKELLTTCASAIEGMAQVVSAVWYLIPSANRKPQIVCHTIHVYSCPRSRIHIQGSKTQHMGTT